MQDHAVINNRRLSRTARIRKLFLGRWQYRVTWPGAAFATATIVVGVFAFLSANNLLFLVLSAMLAFGIVSGFLSRLVLAGLELELLLPEHVSARMPASASVRLRNLKYLTPSFSIELSGRPDPDTDLAPILATPVYFPLIPGRSTLEAPVEVTFPRRGCHRDNLFALSTSFPFGFIGKGTIVPLHRETIVYPSLSPSSEAEQLLADVTGEIESRFRGQGLDFHRVRPWESGDTARMVDWRNTAHTGALQVREFTREERRSVEIYLDRCADPDWFEDALETCAYLLWHLSDENTDVALRTDADSYSIPATGDVYGALQLLALMGSGGRSTVPDPELGDAVKVLFTSRPEVFDASKWQPALLFTGKLYTGRLG